MEAHLVRTVPRLIQLLFGMEATLSSQAAFKKLYSLNFEPAFEETFLNAVFPKNKSSLGIWGRLS